MKEKPAFTLKEIIYNETGKTVTEVIRDSFFNFYLTKNNLNHRNDAENTC